DPNSQLTPLARPQGLTPTEPRTTSGDLAGFGLWSLVLVPVVGVIWLMSYFFGFVNVLDYGAQGLIGLFILGATGIAVLLLGSALVLFLRGPAGGPRLWASVSNITSTALHDFVDTTVFLILGAILAATVRMFLT